MIKKEKTEAYKVINAKIILQGVKNSIKSNIAVYSIVSAYTVLLSIFSILKERAFLASGFDLGLFNQAFWTTLFQHKLFYETGDISFNPGGSFFGVHFSPILFLLLPFYAIHPSVEALLVMQSFTLALGAIPLYWLARDHIGKNVGFLTALIYLVYPLVLFVNANDFHLEAFASTFFLFSIYYLQKEKWSKFYLFLILAFSTLEFAPIIGIFVAVYVLVLYLKRKLQSPKTAKKHIFIIAAISILWFALALQTKILFNNTSPVPSSFENIWLNPIGLGNILATQLQEKLFYLVCIFGPLAFFPVLAPETLIMIIPWIGASFLSTYPPYYSPYFQYGGFVIPFIFLAFVKSIERVKHRINLRNTEKIFSLFFICTTIFALFLFFGPQSPWSYQIPEPTTRTQAIYGILSLIPTNASILTENDLFTQVSNRAEAYMYVPRQTNASFDYILFDISSQWYKWQQPEVFGERIPPIEYIKEVLNNGTYGIYAENSSVILLKKGYSGNPVLYTPFFEKDDYNNLLLKSGSIKKDNSAASKQVLVHSNNDPKGIFWYGPYTDLPQGLYKVSYTIKIDNETKISPTDPIITVDITDSSGTTFIAKKQINGTNATPNGQWFNVTLTFGLSQVTEGVEFRGTITGNSTVALDCITIEQLSPQQITGKESFFNYENLLIKNGAVTDGTIINPNQTGTLWYGPYTQIPKGNYTAKFWLKLNSPYQGAALDIAVTSNDGTNLITYSTIYGSSFNEVNSWQSFELPFSLPKDTDGVEFSGINARKSAPIAFLLVEVSPNE